MLKSLWKFVSYWYFRYLLVTELYMVEKWERVFIRDFPEQIIIDIFFIFLFGSLSYFNSRVTLSFVEFLTINMNMGHISTTHSMLDNSAHPSLMGEL